MANINFPDSPSDGDIFGEHRYNATKGVWEWYVLPGDTTAEDLLLPGQFLGYGIEYLVIAGGGGGARTDVSNNYGGGGGGGAGGYRSSVVGESSGGGASYEPKLNTFLGTYNITIGAGGSGSTTQGSKGQDSIFGSIVSDGGGGAGGSSNATSGGSGGAGSGTGSGSTLGASGTPNQGFSGANGTFIGGVLSGGGSGGGAGGSGTAETNGPPGGIGVSSSITGVLTERAVGGSGASGYLGGGNVAKGGGNGEQNKGNGGNGSEYRDPGSGGSGVVIFKISSAADISFSVGLTEANGGSGQTVGDYKVYTVTAGTGTVTIS